MNAKKKKIFIGVAWPYVNGDIHIGHLAGYLFPADIFARFKRFRGDDVLMVSGSDCFGTPITLEADKRGVSPQEIVDEYHVKNVELFKILGISFDNYTKTDTDNHREVVQNFFVALLNKGFIFKDTTEQYYSPKEKRFLPDRYVEGECPHCGYKAARSDQCDECGAVLDQGEFLNPRNKLTGAAVELRPTEHYFLDWPKLQGFLERYVASRKNWRPWVLNETKGWLEKGLKPRPITRDLDWGVEIPVDRIPKELQIDGAGSKRIYVWFEAVIGYLSASIEADKLGKIKNRLTWEDFWYDDQAEHAYFMGKDNLVFHTLFWPGQLHEYDENIHLPDFPSINQFLTLEGQKFSKSRGVTIDSRYFVETYGLDTLRFYLTLIAPENADANFGWSDFLSKHNDLLIGNFGNFVNRTLTLTKGLDFSESSETDAELELHVLKFVRVCRYALQGYEFKKYAETILALSDFGNKYLSKEEPWFLKDKDPERFKNVMVNAVYIALGLLLLIKPLLPDSYKSLSGFLGVDIEKWEDDEKVLLRSYLNKVRVTGVKPLFDKLDEKVVEVERVKITPAQ